MAIGEQIETIVKSLTGNNTPPQLVSITGAYADNHVDIVLNDGKELKNIESSGRGVMGTSALLIYRDNNPLALLFEKAEDTINSLGLGLFNIYDTDLYIELPVGADCKFSIIDGDLIVEDLKGYSIVNKDLTYERWDF